MPDTSTKLGLSLPLGNEAVTRLAYRQNLEQIDLKAATQDQADEPFFLKSAIYNSGLSRIDCTFGKGRAAFLGTLIVKNEDSTTQIPNPIPSTSYYLYIKNDGTYAFNTTGAQIAGGVQIWKVTIGTTVDQITKEDRRGELPGAAAKIVQDNLDAHNHDERYYTETEIGSATDGNAGADKVGATMIPGLSGNTVQTVLESAKTALDGKAASTHNHSYLPLSGGTLTGNLIIDASTSAFEIGKYGQSNTPYIDFHSGATGSDFDARVIASGGDGTSGHGTLNFQCTNLQHNGNAVSLSGHTHSYLPLAGGTLSGNLTFAQGNRIITFTNAASGNTQIKFNSGVNPNLDYGLIAYYDDASSIYGSIYDIAGGSNENGTLFIVVDNDQAAASGDQIVLRTGARCIIDANSSSSASQDSINIVEFWNEGIQKAKIDTAGNITATKVYNAVYNDYAEYFLKDGEIEPGDVVCRNPDGDGYIKSHSSYSKLAIGVLSDTYAQCIGGDKGKSTQEQEEKYAPVGLAGKVMVKVTGDIQIGDILVSSNIPGVAMASEGYTPGTVIGKALESHTGNEVHKIQMLIMNI